MPERWLGVVVASNVVTIVDAEIPDSGPIVIQGDHSWPLQTGDRASAYNVMHQRVTDYAREHGVAKAIVKASAISLRGMRKAHLEAAELRGVVMSALASATTTQSESKAHMTRTFGKRNVDEYIVDEAFWSKRVIGAKLRKGSREAAMVLLAGRKQK